MWLLPDSEREDYIELSNKDMLLGNKCIKCAKARQNVDTQCDTDEAVLG